MEKNIYDKIRQFLNYHEINVRCTIEDFQKYIIENKIDLYSDMDGVLVRWTKDIRTKYIKENGENQPNFFYNLEPIQYNVDAFNLLLELLPNNMFILTKVPNKMSEKDKFRWNNLYVPNIKKNHIIMVASGKSKENFVKRNIEKSILMDDYGKIISGFRNAGGMVIKVLNEINSTNKMIRKENEKYEISDVFKCENIISVIKYFEEAVLLWVKK